MSVVPLTHALDLNEFGSKAYHLGAALRAGLPVPPGFALSVEALSQVHADDAVTVRSVCTLFGELGAPVAARSSAIGEDGAAASFAGQHLTVLNLCDHDAVIDGLKRVRQSAHTEAALGYRAKQGIAGPIRIAAVVQQLVEPLCAGVLFTRNPVTGAHEQVIEAAWGLGETVVAGLVTPDHYRLGREGRVLEIRIGEKDIAMRRLPSGGVHEVDVAPALVNAPCLNAVWLTRLHDLAMRCEACFGPALDLEWAIAGDQLYLLQSRPISVVRG